MDTDIMAQDEKADRDSRSEFAIEEFEDNFDELFARVEGGETLTILHTNGQKVLMVPSKCLIGSTRKRD